MTTKTNTTEPSSHFMYSTVNDYDIRDRKTRLVHTRQRLNDEVGGKKNACMRYIPTKGKHLWRRIIADPSGKPIYYLSTGRLGDRDSLDGEAYRICKPTKTDIPTPKGFYQAYCNFRRSYVLAVKVIPLTVEEATHINNSLYRTWKEIKILKEVTQLLLKGVSQNLPIYYTDLICPDSKVGDYQNQNIINYFKNSEQIKKMAELIKEISDVKKQLTGIKHYKDIKKKINTIYQRTLREFLKNDIKPEKQYSTKSVLVFNEISDFDFTHLLENDPEFVLRREYILPTIFQVLHGIAAIQQKLEIVHFDLHLSNVLVTKVTPTPGRFWHYRINKTDYYIPNQGYLFKIWDFGRSSYLHKDSPDNIKKKIIKQFSRFFRFNLNDFTKKLDVTFKKASFRKYLYSFDVFRFFSAYHSKLIQSINQLSKTKSKTKISTTNYITTTASATGTTQTVSTSLNSMNPRQINQLPEVEILKKINDYAFEDIMYYLISPRIKKHTYRGGPQMLIKKLFAEYTVAPSNPNKNILNYGEPFTIED